MIDCVQIRLETLRHQVRDPSHHRNRQPPVLNECGPITTAFNNQTRVALFQLTNTNRPIQMSRFTVIPVNNHSVPVAKSPEKKTNRMLHVKVNDDDNKKREQTLSKSENCSSSPSDSTDSGMPSSPAFLSCESYDDEDILSPLPASNPAISGRFHFNGTPHTSPSIQPQFRTRSSSECLDTRQTPFTNSSINGFNSGNGLNNGSSNSLSSSGTPLRSILKKPKILAPGMGNTCIVATSATGLRRVSTRYVLARSVSECHDDPTAILADGEELQFVDDVVSMEDLTVGSSPLSVCAEEDESNDSDEPQIPTPEQQSKKRVSFNEQVQARIYRSTSSIVSTQNKQARKLRNRIRKRAESESSDTSAIDPNELIHVPIIPLCTRSAEEKHEDIEVDQKDLLNQRRDSTDSGMESPPQYEDEKMQVEMPKQVQRIISSDSAFGDEIDME